MTNPLTDAQIDELLVGTKYAPPYEVWVEDKTLPEGGYWQTTESEFRLEVDARLNAARVIQLEAELAQLRAENEWQDISTVTEDIVLEFYCPNLGNQHMKDGSCIVQGVGYYNGRVDDPVYNEWVIMGATHWRKPNPPQAKEGE